MSRTIPLTQGYVVTVDEDMCDFLNRWNWYYGPGGYATRGTRATGKYRNIFLHRVVAALMFGEIPAEYEVDHRDGDRLNCTTANLRLATSGQNSYNSKPLVGFTSTYKGVYWKKGQNKWCAAVRLDKKVHHVGYFEDEIEAAKARDEKAVELMGEFARLNFP